MNGAATAAFSLQSRKSGPSGLASSGASFCRSSERADRRRLEAEGLGDRRVVDVGEHRLRHRQVAHLEEVQLRAIGAVVHQHDDQRQVLAHHGLQLAHGHQEAAVADHQHRGLVGPSALATPSAVPKPRPIEAKSLVSLKWPGSGHRQVGHDAEEVAGVVDDVAVGRQQLLQRHAERARDRPCAACWPAGNRGRCRSRAGSPASPRSGTAGRRWSRAAAPRAGPRAASFASPTTATSAGCQRPIWPRSASTWISGTLGSEWPKLMVRRLSPAPNTSTQSAWSIIRRAAECENEPTIPRLAGWPRNMSLPRAEVTSSAPMRSASCSSAALAPARWAPRPATISGLRLCRTSAAAASIACGRGAAGGRGGFCAGGGSALAEIHVGELDVDRQQQRRRPALLRRARRHRPARRARCSGLVATKVRMPAAPSTPVALKPL